MMEISNSEKSSEKLPGITDERRKLIDDVFNNYHQQLNQWCRFKLNGYKLSGNYSEENIGTDVEDIVAAVYQSLLLSKVQIDLSRDEHEVKKFLNNALDYQIAIHIQKIRTSKRKNSVSLESLLEGQDDEMASNIKEYFTIRPDPDIQLQINQALSIIESRDPKTADIVRKKFIEGKTYAEIAQEYGDSKSNPQLLGEKGLKILKNILSGRLKTKLSIFPQKSKI